jgi:regulator of protease activity HflC (stomatin/prohibitin superfamily)
VIDFLKQRSKRQNEAKESISAALSEYNVGAVDTLIGDITPPAELMKTLTDRKLAEQEQITYGTQEQAEMIRKNLAQATAMADTQPGVVTAERSVQIASFTADATVKTAQGQAKAKRSTPPLTRWCSRPLAPPKVKRSLPSARRSRSHQEEDGGDGS